MMKVARKTPIIIPRKSMLLKASSGILSEKGLRRMVQERTNEDADRQDDNREALLRSLTGRDQFVGRIGRCPSLAHPPKVY